MRLYPLKIFVFGILFALSTLSLAGSESGGGGTYVLRDNEYVISDRYYREMGEIIRTPVKQVKYEQLPLAVQRAANTMTEFMYLRLGIETPNIKGNTPYLLVPKELEQQAMCNQYKPILQNRADVQLRYGCTNGDITFLFVDSLGMADLRHQAYALLHERLWTLPNSTQQLVVDIVDGVMSLEEAVWAQQENPHMALPKDLFKKMDALYAAADKLGLKRDEFTHYDRTEGGGWVKPGCLDPESRNNVIGLTSRVECQEKQQWEGNAPFGRITLVKHKRQALLTNTVLINSRILDVGVVDDSNFEASEVISHSVTDGTMSDSNGIGLLDDEVERCYLRKICRLIPAPEIHHLRMKNSTVYGNLLVHGSPDAEVVLERSRVATRSIVSLKAGIILKGSVLGSDFGDTDSPMRIEVGENVRLTDFSFFGVSFPGESDKYPMRYDILRGPLRVLSNMTIEGVHVSGVYKPQGMFGRIFTRLGDPWEVVFGNRAGVNAKNRVVSKDVEGREFAYRAWSDVKMERWK